MGQRGKTQIRHRAGGRLTERGKDGEEYNLAVLEQTSPSLVVLGSQNGVEIASCGSTTSHDECM
jgi:hypothetical protein